LKKGSCCKSIKAQNLNDPEIDELLKQADAKLAAERAALNKPKPAPERLLQTRRCDNSKKRLPSTIIFKSIAGPPVFRRLIRSLSMP